MKEIIFRLYQREGAPSSGMFRVIYSDGFTVEELEELRGYVETLISNKRAMEPQSRFTQKEEVKQP